MGILKKNRLSVVLALISTALLSIPAQALANTSASNSEELEQAKIIIKENLKDPESAQFRNLVIVQNSMGDVTVCGEYNARNSYGGYVGFQPFGVNGQISITETAELERAGCFGIGAETERRKKDARHALIERFKNEADFNCNVIWTLLDNHFRNEESREVALDSAMTATLNRARVNGGDISPQVLQTIRDQYELALISTSKEAEQVKSIRREDATFKSHFISGCKLKSVQAMEAQISSL